ncbi:hypothetical protein HY991_03055 [Candidatus Micrarchaeota archaeon]|nr:hypothetical protein [Candidatus Micrarchaeota archaeon]
MECGKPCEVYSRVVGYFRPVQNWNEGKQAEFNDRLEFNMEKSLASEHGNKVEIGEIEKTTVAESGKAPEEKKLVACECKT